MATFKTIRRLTSVVLFIGLTAACSSNDAKDFFYTFGQVTYDSLKNFQEDEARQPFQ